MAWTRAALGFVAAGLAVGVLVSGGSSGDPRTPRALPGEPAPFLGTAVVGSGGLTAAIDAYGDVVDLRAPGPAGQALIDNPSERQAAGIVAADTGVVTRVAVNGELRPLWRADSVRQSYLPGTNVLQTVARFGTARVEIVTAAIGARVERCVRASAPSGWKPRVATSFNLEPGARVRCTGNVGVRAIREAARADRRWLAGAQPLGRTAPAWARRMYRRSLLVLRALTDRRSGAVAAGARDGWAYVWPRDAGAVALAFAAAGYRAETRRAARFLLGLDLGSAARFHGDGAAVEGRESQGDAWGWTAVAAHAAGLPMPPGRPRWSRRADYQEKSPGDFLANAIASTAHSREAAAIEREFGGPEGLVREAGEPQSGWDSAAAWGIRPFALPVLYPAMRASLRSVLSREGHFGLVPSEDWPGDDPWTAPTAWTAWSLAALGDRRPALQLMTALRRAATPAGLLPERVDADTGIPVSTTPLAWSHAFAILALRRLWPGHADVPEVRPPMGCKNSGTSALEGVPRC